MFRYLQQSLFDSWKKPSSGFVFCIESTRTQAVLISFIENVNNSNNADESVFAPGIWTKFSPLIGQTDHFICLNLEQLLLIHAYFWSSPLLFQMYSAKGLPTEKPL